MACNSDNIGSNTCSSITNNHNHNVQIVSKYKSPFNSDKLKDLIHPNADLKRIIKGDKLTD